MPAIADLRLFQMGKEATRGTAVPATSKCAVENIDFEPEDTIYRPRLARGLIVRNSGGDTVVMRGTKWTIPDCPVSYEQLQNWLSMSVVGVSAPTGAGPYVWTYTRNPAAEPAPISWTLERRLTDGSTPKDNEWTYCLASKIAIKAAREEALKFSVEGFARRIQSSTLTAAMSMPTIEVPPHALSRIYVDSTWAALGTTNVAGQLLNWEVEFTTGLKPIFTADNRSDLDFQSYVIDSADVQIRARLQMLVAAQYDTEKTAAEAGTLRAIRLQADGTSGRQLQIDFLARHSRGSVFKVGEEQGQDIVEMELEEATDGTNLISFKLTNNVATMT